MSDFFKDITTGLQNLINDGKFPKLDDSEKAAIAFEKQLTFEPTLLRLINIVGIPDTYISKF